MIPRFKDGSPMFGASGEPMLCETDDCCPCGAGMAEALDFPSRTIEVDVTTAPAGCYDADTPKLLPYIGSAGLLLGRWLLVTATTCNPSPPSSPGVTRWRFDVTCIGGGPNTGNVTVGLYIECSNGTGIKFFEEIWSPSLVYMRFGGNLPFSLTPVPGGFFTCAEPVAVTITP